MDFRCGHSGPEIPADPRDGSQNVAQGDFGEATFDGVGLAPGVVNDAPKVISIIRKWVRLHPNKVDEAYRALDGTDLTDRLRIADHTDVLKEVARRDDADPLSNSYNGETLEAIVRAGSWWEWR